MDKSLATELYKQMYLIRLFEDECSAQYMQGKIRGFLHLYIGEEAIAVGSISALRQNDYVVSHYRDHGHALARGLDPKMIMAELMGKVTGVSGGRGGSMHLFDVAKNFMGGYAIVGGQLPIAAGLALAIDRLGEDRVVLCFLGDGAVNEGIFHETLNLASLWKLPVIFVLENNMYGMGSHIDDTHAAGRDLYIAADAFNIPAIQVDGMNLTKVRDCTIDALQRIRDSGGPIFLEAVTYRYQGHSMADPMEYRDKVEVDAWRTKDPISQFVNHVVSEGLIGPEIIAEVQEEVKAVVKEATEFALRSDEPTVDSMYGHVYG